MNEGFELDNFIATRVMGWVRGPRRRAESGEQLVHYCWHWNGEPWASIHSFSPSSRIESAWIVGEHVFSLGLGWILVSRPKPGCYEARMDPKKHRTWVESGTSAPRVICLAALRAVGVDLYDKKKCLRDIRESFEKAGITGLELSWELDAEKKTGARTNPFRTSNLTK